MADAPRSSRRRPRRYKTKRVTSAHWLNLVAYMLVLVIVLFGVSALGDGTASCFMDAAAPEESAPPAP